MFHQRLCHPHCEAMFIAIAIAVVPEVMILELQAQMIREVKDPGVITPHSGV